MERYRDHATSLTQPYNKRLMSKNVLIKILI